MLQVLVDVEGVQELRVKTGQQHVDHNRDVDLVMRLVGVGLLEIGIRPLLVFDALLHVLIIEIEFTDFVIGAVLGVVVGEDGLQRFLLSGSTALSSFSSQVFLDLLHIRIAVSRRGEDAGDVQRPEADRRPGFLPAWS